MISHIPAHKRYHAKHGWLDTFHLFSFAQYYDPENVHFGNLRVFNDDRIDAFSGFDDHDHEEMEIVTIMLEGELTHRDSLGNKKLLKAGEVQRMSAGTGVTHAEKNLGNTPVHLYQIWFLPNRVRDLPSYEQKDFSYQLEKNVLHPLVKPGGGESVLDIHADVTISRLDLEKDKTIAYSLKSGKGLFVYVERGSLVINGELFLEGDQARIQDQPDMMFTSAAGGVATFIEVSLDALS